MLASAPLVPLPMHGHTVHLCTYEDLEEVLPVAGHTKFKLAQDFLPLFCSISFSYYPAPWNVKYVNMSGNSCYWSSAHTLPVLFNSYLSHYACSHMHSALSTIPQSHTYPYLSLHKLPKKYFLPSGELPLNQTKASWSSMNGTFIYSQLQPAYSVYH